MPHSPFGQYKLQVQRQKAPRPQEVTLDDFSGGLNISEADLKLTTNYSKVETNVYRDVDGTKAVRWGTKFKYNMSGTVTGNIIEMEYFRARLVTFHDTGQIGTVTDTGTKALIWSAAIAAALPGAPAGWSTGLTLIDTTEFKNEMIVCNGVDKPLLISKTFVVTYLQDVATGSNVNVPIGKFCTTVGNYLVIAGVAATPDVIYISSAGTSGTWPGDPLPNDSLSINIASYTAQQGGDIRGLSSFRNFLIVHFATSSVVIVLGEYTAAVHKPRILDTIPEHGVLSHRMIELFETELLYCDELGVHRVVRNTFGNALESKKISANIQTAWVADASNVNINRLKSFSVKLANENRVMAFIRHDVTNVYKVWTATFNEGFKKVAWSQFTGWDWSAGTATEKGRIFFATGSKIYQYGNAVFPNEDFTADFVNDFSPNWATATVYAVGNKVTEGGLVYIALVAHTSGTFAVDLAAEFWELYAGESITFDWEMPWTDAKSRMKKKRISYIGIDTIGYAAFTIEIYVDNFRLDENGLDDPAISMEFVAGSSPGYGGGDQPYGGGRRAADERLWGFPCEFKIFKPRLKGATKERMQWVALSFLISQGTYKR